MMKIIVDADACPVKDEIVAAARDYGSAVIMVASHAHVLHPREGVSNIQVDASDQAADLYIANHVAPGDILVTQDFGLAALGLGKGAIVLSNRGQRYTDETINFLLEKRYDSAKRRRSGQHTKGPKAFKSEDRDTFSKTLKTILRNLQENRLC